MSLYDDREPFVTDTRLQRIETQVRLRFPTLPDDARFATARVDEERRAHFLLISPIPGVPDPFRMVSARKVPYSRFEQYERERSHYVSGGREDPVLWIFEHMAADLDQRLASAAEMNHPED